MRSARAEVPQRDDGLHRGGGDHEDRRGQCAGRLLCVVLDETYRSETNEYLNVCAFTILLSAVYRDVGGPPYRGRDDDLGSRLPGEFRRFRRRPRRARPRGRVAPRKPSSTASQPAATPGTWVTPRLHHYPASIAPIRPLLTDVQAARPLGTGSVAAKTAGCHMTGAAYAAVAAGLRRRFRLPDDMARNPIWPRPSTRGLAAHAREEIDRTNEENRKQNT